MSDSKKRRTKRSFIDPAKDKQGYVKGTIPGYAIVERTVYDVVKRGTRGIDPDTVVATKDSEGEAEAVLRELCGGCNGHNFGPGSRKVFNDPHLVD